MELADLNKDLRRLLLSHWTERELRESLVEPEYFFDQVVSPRMDYLRRQGHDVDTVLDENLQGHADPEIWRAAQAEQRFLITQDLDFSDVRYFQPDTHAGLLLVRLQEPGRLALTRKIPSLFTHEDVES